MSKFNETIFLTGFPGFIAGRLVKQLAKSDTQFFLLVQKSFIEKAMKEVEKIAAESKTPLEHFAIIEGDITKENLGMSAEDLQVVQDETTCVYHLAAVYDLAVAKSIGYAVNVEGTKNINELVKKIKNLQRYNYISTCYVSGKRKGVVREDELTHEAGVGAVHARHAPPRAAPLRRHRLEQSLRHTRLADHHVRRSIP